MTLGQPAAGLGRQVVLAIESVAMEHPLSDEYRSGRDRLLDLGRTLTEDEGRTRTTACPEWTVKDVYAHLAGISTDILSGNTDKAATPEWADGHVAQRGDRSLTEVLDEWADAGPQVSELVESAGESFPFQLFVDQWTHEWDIRAAFEDRVAVVPDVTVFRHVFEDLVASIRSRPAAAALDQLTVEVDGQRFRIGGEDRPDLGELSLTMFEFARITMGRRSRRQLRELEWPMDDIDAHAEALVLWSVSEIDVIDPALPIN